MPKRSSLQIFIKLQVTFCQAVKQCKNQNYEKAQKLLHKVLKQLPSYGNAYYLLSNCCAHLHKYQEDLAVEYNKIAMNLNPCFYHTNNFVYDQIFKQISYLCQQIKTRLQDKKQVQWERIIDKVGKRKDLNTCNQLLKLFQMYRKPSNKQYSPQFLSSVGINHYQIGNYYTSLKYYEFSISIKNTEYKYYNNSAILLYIMKKYQNSLQFINKSLELKPGYPKTFFIMSFSLCYSNKQLALQKINYSISQESKSVMYRLKRITILLQYYNEKTTQILAQLLETREIIQKKKDPDTYFSNSDNLPFLETCVIFLIQNFEFSSNAKQIWQNYISLLDDYLIKGHYDKYRIMEEMIKLALTIKQKLEQKKNININKEEQILQNQQNQNKPEQMGEQNKKFIEQKTMNSQSNLPQQLA